MLVSRISLLDRLLRFVRMRLMASSVDGEKCVDGLVGVGADEKFSGVLCGKWLCTCTIRAD